MIEGFSTAIMLLAVGMVTVFTILALVVVFGNILISLVNKFIPEEKIDTIVNKVSNGAIDQQKVAAIVSAVDVVTKGKAKVTSIKKT
jgi:oxaloacetate decarboxylase gamma subunit